MRSCWVKAITVVLLAVLLLAGVWLYFDIKYQRMIDVELARIRAEGWPTTLAEGAPKPVSDEQNAAVLYQQVFQIDFDAPDPWAGSDLLPDIDYDLMKAFREQPTSEIKKQVRTLLTNPETAKLLNILRQASERPHSVFPVQWEQWPGTFVPHYGKFRKACYLISLRALASARAGRIGEALDWCRVGLRMSEHVAAENTLIGQLVSIAMNSIIVAEPRRFLNTAAVSPQDARRMEVYLRQIDLYAHFTKAMIMERALGLAEFRVHHDNPTTCYNIFCPDYRNTIGDFGELFEMLSGCPDFLSEFTVKIYCSPFAWPLQKVDQLYYLTMMREQIEFSKQPYHLVKTRYDAQQQALEEMASYQVPATRILTPVYGRAAAKRGYSIAGIGLFRVVLALKAYKYERGAYPDSLEKLKETLDWQLPDDPFTGNDFVYRRQAEGFKLYSWGPDLEDDGGMPEQDERGKWRGLESDIVWECSR